MTPLVRQIAERIHLQNVTLGRYCPIFGKRPEVSPENEGTHIWQVQCDKCQNRTIVWTQ